MLSNMNLTGTDKVKAETIMVPGVGEVRVEPGLYLSLLKNLHLALIEPKLRLEELMILGHKIGGVKMGEILQWANGHLSGIIDEDGLDNAKNE